MKIRAAGGALGQQGGALGQQGAPPCYSSLWETLCVCYCFPPKSPNFQFLKSSICLKGICLFMLFLFIYVKLCLLHVIILDQRCLWSKIITCKI